MAEVAKKVTSKKYILPEETPSLVQEPQALYMPTGLKKIPTVEEFTYRRFQKVANKIPFSLKEWANILHLSERTLQRYAKDNTSFEGIYVDRILHIEQLIDAGLQAFVSGDALYHWLKRDKSVLGKMLTFESLYSTTGIQELIHQIGRILYGVYT